MLKNLDNLIIQHTFVYCKIAKNIFLTCLPNFLDINESQLNFDSKSIAKKASIANNVSDQEKVQDCSIFNDDSSSTSERKKLSSSSEQVKIKGSNKLMTTVNAKRCRINIHMRKDVINKTIIRAFSRFYIKCFKPKLGSKNQTTNMLYSSLYNNVNEKITSSASYQEYFGLADDPDRKSKLQL